MLEKFLIGPSDRSARLAGIGLMLFGVFMFALGDALGKHMVTMYAVGQLLLLRSLASLALMSPSIWQHRASFAKIDRPGMQLIRVMLSSAEVVAFFGAAVYLPLADIITYYLASPIFVTAGSALFLKEHVDWRRWTAVAVGFAGVLVALRPSPQSLDWPALIALSGSAFFAAQMLITRSLRGTPDVVLAASQFASTLTLGGVLTLFAGWTTPSLQDLGLFMLASVLAVGALLSVNRSLILAPASVVVPYQYSMIIWAMIMGYLVFGDVPAFSVVAGAAIIIAAGFYIFLRERDLSKDEPVVLPPPA